jgi:hypothetical protein
VLSLIGALLVFFGRPRKQGASAGQQPRQARLATEEK